MTDKQKEILFNSIVDFDGFIKKIESCQPTRLSEKIKIEFDQGTVTLQINEASIALSTPHFQKVVDELKEQNRIADTNSKIDERKREEDKRRNELTHIQDNIFRVEPEFYETMLFARDNASAQRIYKERLGMIVKVLRENGKIILNHETITSLSGLENKMKNWYGFKSIEAELKY